MERLRPAVHRSHDRRALRIKHARNLAAGAGLAKAKLRGRDRVDATFTLALTA